MSPKETAYIVERLAVRFMSMVADYERKLAEHRASFGARTSADAKIIEGLRKEIGVARMAVLERDGLLTQVQDQRAEIERLRNDERKAYQDGEAMRVERDALRAEVADLRGTFDMVHASLGIKRGDHIGKAIEALKAHTPKRSHPVAVGGYLRRLSGFNTTPAGEVARVLYVDCDGPATEYTVKRPNGQQGVWSESGCEPCGPPADHDTPAGKEAAKAVIRDSQMTEIKAGTKLRLCKVPMPDPQLSGLVDFPWNAEWGSVGDVAEVINTLNPASLPAVAVRLESDVVWWPRSCIEIVRKVPQ